MKTNKNKYIRETISGTICLIERIGYDRNGNPKYNVIKINKTGADQFDNVVSYNIKETIKMILKEHK